MVIQVDAEGQKAVEFLTDAVLKAHGNSALQSVIQILQNTKPIPVEEKPAVPVVQE